MKNYLILALLLLVSCSNQKLTEKIILELKEVSPAEKEEKVVLIISKTDCSLCIKDKLINFFSSSLCKEVFIVGVDENSKPSISPEIAQVFESFDVKIHHLNSINLLIELAKYTSNPQSPYIATYSTRETKLQDFSLY
ncbi:MAG: hypothetical protein HWD84_10635 [Flavobacteriaceae bacterium]|nr:hypothetical protein [Flavobacteriaceae bacterium]